MNRLINWTDTDARVLDQTYNAALHSNRFGTVFLVGTSGYGPAATARVVRGAELGAPYAQKALLYLVQENKLSRGEEEEKGETEPAENPYRFPSIFPRFTNGFIIWTVRCYDSGGALEPGESVFTSFKTAQAYARVLYQAQAQAQVKV